MDTKKNCSSSFLGTERIGKLIFKFAIPMIISQLVTSVYNVVDQIFVGQYVGYLGNAATTVVFPIVNIGTAVALLFGSGAASNFSLNAGKQKKDALYYVGNGLLFMAIFSTLLSIFIFTFRSPLLMLFGATEQSISYAYDYVTVIAVGLPFSIISVGGSLLVRADASPRYATISLLAGAIINCILDPIFLFKFNMGMVGAALATIIGQFVSFIMVAVYFTKFFAGLKAGHFAPRWCYFKAVFSLGAALAANQIAISIVNIILNNQLRYYGARSAYGSDVPIACVGIITKINTLLVSIQIGVAQGCQPINGYNYGAGHYGRVRQTYKAAVKILVAVSTLSFVFFEAFPRQVISIFGVGTPEYFSFATKLLRFYMLFVIISGIQPVSSNFLTSIGKAGKGTILFLTRQVFLLLPFIVIFPMFFGIDGIIYATPMADFISFLWAVAFMKREFSDMKRLEDNS